MSELSEGARLEVREAVTDDLDEQIRRNLHAFAVESNMIEDIEGATDEDVAALAEFLEQAPSVDSLVRYVSRVEPDAELRDRLGRNVRVGEHIAPPGGPAVRQRLSEIVTSSRGGSEVHDVHANFENLHPFTDGNGRAGRALWLWMMIDRGQSERVVVHGFLRTFYYQTLARYDRFVRRAQ